MSAYSLLELPTLKNRLELITNLWNKTSNYLVFIEYGSNAGYKVINEVREYLLELNKVNQEEAFIFAPCPHEDTCPRFALNDGTPCNFVVSYNTLPLLGPTAVHKELYSYLVVKKGRRTDEPDSSWPRVIRPTLVRAKHSICRLCTEQGKLQEIIFTASKQGKMVYRCAKATRWGDRIPVKIDEPKIE